MCVCVGGGIFASVFLTYDYYCSHKRKMRIRIKYTRHSTSYSKLLPGYLTWAAGVNESVTSVIRNAIENWKKCVTFFHHQSTVAWWHETKGWQILFKHSASFNRQMEPLSHIISYLDVGALYRGGRWGMHFAPRYSTPNGSGPKTLR